MRVKYFLKYFERYLLDLREKRIMRLRCANSSRGAVKQQYWGYLRVGCENYYKAVGLIVETLEYLEVELPEQTKKVEEGQKKKRKMRKPRLRRMSRRTTSRTRKKE